MVCEDVAVGLGSVLRTAIRVMNAAFGRLPCLDSRLQRRDGNAGIDRAADRPAARAVGATIRPAIVHGFGGIGMSTLAREYAFASQQAV
jgi:hypothetical protein